MADKDSNDRTQRVILIGLVVFALILIGATIFSTVHEWNLQDDPGFEATDPPASG